MHFKEDINLVKLTQYINLHGTLMVNEKRVSVELFEELEDSKLIAIPEENYHKCAGKTAEALTVNVSEGEIIDTFDAIYGVTYLNAEARAAFRALIAEEGDCICGGELEWTGDTIFGEHDTPYIHRCNHCKQMKGRATIVNEELYF